MEGASSPFWWKAVPADCLWHGVFQGGGAKGVAYAGALDAMQDCGQWFASAAGSSAGALTAALVAAGFSPEDMDAMTAEMLHAISPDTALDTLLLRVPWTRWLTRYSAAGLEQALERRLREGVKRHGAAIDGDVTFAQLHSATGIGLYVLALDASTGRPLPFSAESTPDLPVAVAVAASCAIPVVFPPRHIEIDLLSSPLGAWPPLRRVVDGGAWANFPVLIYHDDAFRDYYGLAPLPAPGKVLGFVFDEAIGPPIPAKPRRFVEDPGRHLHPGAARRLLAGPRRRTGSAGGRPGEAGAVAGRMAVALAGAAALGAVVYLGVLAAAEALRGPWWAYVVLAAAVLATVAGGFVGLRLWAAIRGEGTATLRSLIGMATAPPVWAGASHQTDIIWVPARGIETTDFFARSFSPATARADAREDCGNQLRQLLNEGTTHYAANRLAYRDMLPTLNLPAGQEQAPLPTHTTGLDGAGD